MRPKAIITFERLFLLSIVLSTIQLAIDAGARIGRVGPITELVVEAAGIMLSVLLVLLASRRRSNIARWLLVAFTAIGLFATGADVSRTLRAGEGFDVALLVNLIGIALQTAAVALLFRPEARAWFARREPAAPL